jgi:hypothetical protein
MYTLYYKKPEWRDPRPVCECVLGQSRAFFCQHKKIADAKKERDYVMRLAGLNNREDFTIRPGECPLAIVILGDDREFFTKASMDRKNGTN